MSPPEHSTPQSTGSATDHESSKPTDLEVTMPAEATVESALPSNEIDEHTSPRASTLDAPEISLQRNHHEPDTAAGPLTSNPDTEDHDTAATAQSKGKEVEGPAVFDDSSDPTASIATLRPAQDADAEADQSHLLVPETSNYVDPTPPTPTASRPPSRSPSTAARSHDGDNRSPTRSDPDNDEKRNISEDEQEGGSRLEIQNIMDQFSEFGGGPGAEEVMSPRLEIASPMLGSPVQHPPRKSSLEPLSASVASQIPELQKLHITTSHGSSTSGRNTATEQAPPVPPKDDAFDVNSVRTRDERATSMDSPSVASLPVHRPPPPEPEPEPALPFDFHRFLEQLRNKKADPVARYLKSFLSEFGKKQWMVHEQVKIISDFLAFIANKMMQCEVWRDVSDAEFENAREGMEKLVMNRLYSQTFSPAIPPPKPVPGAKAKRKGVEQPLGPGRRGQHQEDVERDDIITQKINIYGWIREEHLDMPVIGDSGKRFLRLAQQELLKIKSYRAPRDKIICVLNCCKVIFGLLKHNKSDGSADSFMPLLIYVVLQANPEHLVSNVQYILRFRNQDKLGGEAGYYLSSLMGAVQFIENMDRTTLTITDDDFEKNVEAAVSAIAEKHLASSPTATQQPTFNEKSSLHPPEHSQRPSMDGGDTLTPRRSLSSNEGDAADINAPISGLLRTIQKPLSSIGRIFSEETAPTTSTSSSAAAGGSATSAPQQQGDSPRRLMRPDPRAEDQQRPSSRHNLSAEEAAARQASAEVAEAQRLQRAEHSNVVETLAGMFPDLDKDIISDVVYQKEGRVGLAVDACLALST